MNILMIFFNNPLEVSGAVTLDLFNEFRKRKHNVKLLVNVYNRNYPEGVVSMETFFLFWKNKVLNKIRKIAGKKKVNTTVAKYHFQNVNEERLYFKTSTLLKKAGIKPDAIIILFARNYVSAINAKNIYELHKLTGKPVYWLLYDTGPLTGGCHYSWDCTGYQNSCGNCPGLNSTDPHDITYRNLAYKKKYMPDTDISMVVASEWQYAQVVKSAVFKDHPVHKMMISINPEVFKPVAKEISRGKTGIALDKKVIFFGAKSFDDDRKGFIYLKESLEILKTLLDKTPALKEKVTLLIAGSDMEKYKLQLPFEVVNIGLVDNNYGIASAYQAADVFLCPSIEDAGPSMVNQSLMCGTPIVSFAQGVSLDLVISGKTGYRVKMKDSEDMAQGLYNILSLNENEYKEMKNNCRKMALELIHPDVIVEKWLDLLQADNRKVKLK